MVNWNKIESRNLISAALLFAISLVSIFSLVYANGGGTHVGEEGEESTVDAILTPSVTNPQPNQTVLLDFYLSSNNVPLLPSQLSLVHTKILHLIGMRNDLNHYFHIHPETSSLGHYVVNHTFPADGVYTLWLEFEHDNKASQESFIVIVGNGQTPPVATDFSTTKIVDGYRVEMHGPPKVKAKSQSRLSFDISDASTAQPVKLGTYLGAFGHVIVVSTDLENFVHAHAGGDAAHGAATGAIVITGRHIGEERGIQAGPEGGNINTVAEFPKEGVYKIFVQFNPTETPDGKVITAEFMLNVNPAGGFNPFFIVFPLLLIATIAITVALGRYGKTGKLGILSKAAHGTTKDQPEVQGSEKRFKKILILLGFVLFSIFVIGMMWLGSGYDPDTARTDIMFWYILSYTAGLSMIFLPCTLPMAFVIVPLSMGEKPRKGFFMALLFGLGLTITITIYGIVMAGIGKILGFDKATQLMWLVAGSVAFFFGLGELKLLPLKFPGYSGALPGFLQKQGDYLKSFFMGLFLGNAGAGCPNPAFYVLLTYITTVGSLTTGALLGFVHGFGRALPLIVLSIAGIVGLNATGAILKHKDKIEKGGGFVLIVVGSFILTLAIYGKAWWENSIVHLKWSKFLGLFNREFAEAAHGTGTAPLTAFYVVGIIAALVSVWYYLDKKYFRKPVSAEDESVEPEKKAEERIFEELQKIEEKESIIEKLEGEELKTLKKIEAQLSKKKVRKNE